MSALYSEYEQLVQTGLLEQLGRQLQQRLNASPRNHTLQTRLVDNLRARGDLQGAARLCEQIIASGHAAPRIQSLYHILWAHPPDHAAGEETDEYRPTPFWCVDDFLHMRDLAALRTEKRQRSGQFKPAQIYTPQHLQGRVNPDIRVNLVMPSPWATQTLVPRVLDLLPRIRTRLGLAPFRPTPLEVQITKHEDGAYFLPHRDHTAENRRKVSFLLYFEDKVRDFSGGDLILYDEPSQASPLPRAHHTRIPHRHNRFVCFPSDCLHEVTPVRRPDPVPDGGRYAVLGFISETAERSA